MFTKQTVLEIAAVAAEFGLEPAALLAVAEVESNGQAFSVINDRPEPVIRFEGHYFDARLTPEKQLWARASKLASPVPSRIDNPRTQAGRWRLLERAAAIDRKAAYESVSWGLGQVMGAHWSRLGYGSVNELVDEARSGAHGQARLMARYIEKFKLTSALTMHDWHSFARAYNGPDYRRYAYHARLAKAYRKYRGVKTDAGSHAPLRLGATGLRVRQLQLELAARGLLMNVDGIFGSRTERAVRDYQMRNGLTVDGIAGAETMTRLKTVKAVARMAGAQTWTTALARLFKLPRSAAPDGERVDSPGTDG